MKKFLSIIIFILIFFVNIPVAADEGNFSVSDFPQIQSQNIVLMDADSGEVLYARNQDKQCYPASTTKLLTGLLTIENSSMSDIVTFSQNAVNSIEYGDANASISADEQLTVEQSLYCLILRSANDVAYGLGEYIGGGDINVFIDMMNSRLEALGAVNSHFSNTSGLTAASHYTTPYDMALIARECFNNKNLMNIIGYSGLYTISHTNKSNFIRYYRHRYQMLEGGDYEYKYSCGGKTGYTEAAGSCLVSFAQKDDLRLICVIMNSTDTMRYTDTTALFDYYFNNYHKLYISSSLSQNTTDILNIVSELDNSAGYEVSFGASPYIIAPLNVSERDLECSVIYSNSPDYSGSENGFADIHYFCNDMQIGSLTVYVTSTNTDGIPGHDGVFRSDYRQPAAANSYTFINIFYVITAIAAVILILVFIFIFTRIKRRRPYRSGRNHRLHF